MKAAWTLGIVSPKTGKALAVAELSDAVGLPLRNRIAQDIATATRMAVRIGAPVGVRRNPRTVVCDGVTVARLSSMTPAQAAHAARAIATALRKRVSVVHGNPTAEPAAGQLWRSPRGERARVLVAGKRVQVSNLDRGEREWVDRNEFLATWTPARGTARTNPKRKATAPPSLFTVGQRVQLHPATDEWMQGDRYGVVAGFGRVRDYVDTFTKQVVKGRPVRVKLDKSGRVRRFHPDNVSPIDNPGTAPKAPTIYDALTQRFGRTPTDSEVKAEVARIIHEGAEIGRARRKNPHEPSILDAIRTGDRVTIVNRFGQERSGRAVMRGPHGWVLNMGGPHGTPGIATAENIVKVSQKKNRNPRGCVNEPCAGCGLREATTEHEGYPLCASCAERAKMVDRGRERRQPGRTARSRRVARARAKARKNPHPRPMANVHDVAGVFGWPTWNKLTLAEVEAVLRDVRDVANELAGDEEPDDIRGARELRSRIGGAAALKGYAAVLLAGERRRNPKKARKNPRGSDAARAKQVARMWHENEPTSARRMKAPTRVPSALAGLGELRSVVYESDKYAGSKDNPSGKKQLYEHKFSRPFPVLASDGQSLFVVGGKVRVTADGLVN